MADPEQNKRQQKEWYFNQSATQIMLSALHRSNEVDNAASHDAA
jgi:hypothetical protein